MLLYSRFSRIINVTDIGQDYNLDDMFYLLFGRRAAGNDCTCVTPNLSPSHCLPLRLTDQGATTVLGYHTISGGMTPTVSDQQYNPVRDNNTNDRCPIDATVSYSLTYMCMYKILLICIL